MSRHLWAAVALRSGAIPPPAVLRTWLDRHAPALVVRASNGDEADAERRYEFAEGQAVVGAAHFPWTIGPGIGVGPFKAHRSHVFMSVSQAGRAMGREGRRLLARSAAAVAATGDPAFIWWGRTGGVYDTAKFIERVERKAQ